MKISYLINNHAMKICWDSGGTAPRILNLGTRWRWQSLSRPGPFTPGERVHGTHWRMGGPESQSGRDGEEKKIP